MLGTLLRAARWTRSAESATVFKGGSDAAPLPRQTLSRVQATCKHEQENANVYEGKGEEGKEVVTNLKFCEPHFE